MICEHCGGRGTVSVCPPGWKYFYRHTCPACGGRGEAEDEREDELAVGRLVAEGGIAREEDS